MSIAMFLKFAAAHSDRARSFGLSRNRAEDPAVEQLFEVMAFLMGHIEQRLDDDLPELTEGLVNMPIYIEEVGLSKEERLWLHLPNGFDGYRLLLEYFCFRRKFCFVDVCDLDIFRLPENRVSLQ